MAAEHTAAPERDQMPETADGGSFPPQAAYAAPHAAPGSGAHLARRPRAGRGGVRAPGRRPELEVVPGSAAGTTPAPEVIPGQYIVTLKAGVSAETVAQETESRGDKVEHVYKGAGRGFAGKFSDDEVARLKADPRVLRVEADQVVHALGIQAPTPSWGLDRIDERALDGTSSYTYPSTASSVTAYVIDTGIAPGSSDFTGRLGAGQNFVAAGGTVDPANWADCNGHGTHVAGTIGGTTYGVAKGVTLVPVRVLDCSGNGSSSGVIAGLDWMTAQHLAGARAVANLSLGGGFSQSLNDAVTRAVADGVVVVVAAGNSSADACTSSPSSTPSALTVGATDSGDARASFSNYGPCLDVFAPGVGITSDWIGSADATNTISGTSMASPHVAGVAALYLEQGQGANDLLANATTGFVTNAGGGSPDKLVYVGTEPQTAPVRPPNDAFANAQLLTGGTGTVAGTTAYATKETGEPNHAANSGGRSVWYRFTARRAEPRRSTPSAAASTPCSPSTAAPRSTRSRRSRRTTTRAAASRARCRSR